MSVFHKGDYVRAEWGGYAIYGAYEGKGDHGLLLVRNANGIYGVQRGNLSHTSRKPRSTERMMAKSMALMTEVAIHFGVSVEEIVSSTRKRSVADARAVTCYLAYNLCGMSSTEVGQLVHRDHSTIIIAVRKVEQWLELPKINPHAVDIINALRKANNNNLSRKHGKNDQCVK